METKSAQEFIDVDDLSRFVAPSITYAHVTKWMEEYAEVKAKEARNMSMILMLVGNAIGFILAIIAAEIWIF